MMATTFPNYGIAISCLLLFGCSGGEQSPPPAFYPRPAGLVSAASPFPSGCGSAPTGTLYVQSEVEPHLAINPTNPSNLIGVWQQDRWSDGSARGLVAATSFDGGVTWTQQGLPFSRCGGGTTANGGDFERATDPWVTFAPDGTAYFMSLSTNGGVFQTGSRNAMVVARSGDGGRTWSAPIALIDDTAPYFNDKNSITADPTDARFVYATWDRLAESGGGPAFFARSINGGASWEAARSIFDPGPRAQTIGNLIVVLPSGVLINMFTLIEEVSGLNQATIAAIRSTDQGVTWSAPIRIAEMLSVGAQDPETGALIRDGSILAQATAGPDGSLAVVWQDARFSGGSRDSIAFSRSMDGGLTWSNPIRINPNLQVAAFTPSVHIRPDGTLGITYYDLRDNTSSRTTLPTSYFLARSTTGVDWSETRLCEPFDIAVAPNARGYFLGDYQGLKSIDTSFLAFFARTTGDLSNRTDICALRVSGTTISSLAEAAPSAQTIRLSEQRMARYVGEIAEAKKPSEAHRLRVSQNLAHRLNRPPASAKPIAHSKKTPTPNPDNKARKDSPERFKTVQCH